MRTQKRNRAGFSLVEVVIALSVIVIVSVTSISIVLSSISANTKAKNKSYAQYFADNLWECFLASDSQADFLAAVYFAEGVDLSHPQNVGSFNDDGSITYRFTHGQYGFVAVIDVDFSDVGDTFRISVSDGENKEIISFSYEKDIQQTEEATTAS